MLDERVGPGGEKLQTGLTLLPTVHSNWLWQWAYEVQKKEKGGGEKGGVEVYFKDWAGIGFRTGRSRVLKCS